MTASETPDPRAKAEKLISFDAHAKQFGDGEMTKFVDIDCDPENYERNDGVIKNYAEKSFHKGNIKTNLDSTAGIRVVTKV